MLGNGHVRQLRCINKKEKIGEKCGRQESPQLRAQGCRAGIGLM